MKKLTDKQKEILTNAYVRLGSFDTTLIAIDEASKLNVPLHDLTTSLIAIKEENKT